MEKYNGWNSYQTWICKIWIDNDFNLYQHYKTKASQIKDINQLKTILENDFTQQAYNLTGSSGFYCDLLQNSLNQIDFYEIAESLINE